MSDVRYFHLQFSDETDGTRLFFGSVTSTLAIEDDEDGRELTFAPTDCPEDLMVPMEEIVERLGLDPSMVSIFDPDHGRFVLRIASSDCRSQELLSKLQEFLWERLTELVDTSSLEPMNPVLVPAG